MIEVPSYFSGSPSIQYLGETENVRRLWNTLVQTTPNPDIIQERVRKFMDQVVFLENEMAITKGEQPTTGGGINIVTVFPKGIFWSNPKYDSKDDLLGNGR